MAEDQVAQPDPDSQAIQFKVNVKNEPRSRPEVESEEFDLAKPVKDVSKAKSKH